VKQTQNIGIYFAESSNPRIIHRLWPDNGVLYATNGPSGATLPPGKYS